VHSKPSCTAVGKEARFFAHVQEDCIESIKAASVLLLRRAMVKLDVVLFQQRGRVRQVINIPGI